MTIPSEHPRMLALYASQRARGEAMKARHDTQWAKRSVMHEARLRTMHNMEHREMMHKFEEARKALEARLQAENDRYYNVHHLHVPCGDCGSPIGNRCLTASGNISSAPHSSRRVAAARAYERKPRNAVL